MELAGLSEEILAKRTAKATEEGKMEEHGLVPLSKRKAKIKWKESERHCNESAISEWRDAEEEEDKDMVNPEYKYYEEKEQEHSVSSFVCRCSSCVRISETDRNDPGFQVFREQLQSLANCSDCAALISKLLLSLPHPV
jgi:hypothetical protein